MTALSVVGILLGLLWGLCWALFLEHVALGRFLVQQLTWLTVVIGVGVDLAILLIVLPPQQVALVALIVAASGVPVVVRSLLGMYRSVSGAISVLGGPEPQEK
jgi:hypothetical protein